MSEYVTLSHKIRLKRASNESTSKLKQAIGAARFCYNHAKAKSEQHYEEHGKSLSKFGLRNIMVSEVKQTNPWLYDLPKSILESATFDFHGSLLHFFKRGHGFPGFRKRRDGRGSFTLSNAQFKVDGKFLTLTKIGKFQLTENLRFEGKLLSCTVSQKGKHFYASITVEVPKSPLPHTGAEVGVDFNIHDIVTSDGYFLSHSTFFRDDAKKLARAQRVMSRRVKGSNNWKKARDRVRKIHSRISNRRLDAHHKMSHQLVRDNSFIYLEDLNVSGMMKNKRLAKAIADASFGQLTQQIKYKCEINDRVLVQVGRFYPSSKTCSNCGLVKSKLSLSERIFICDGCNFTINRDLNAAINIRNEGTRLHSLVNPDPRFEGSNACGDSVRHALDFRVESVLESVKQEPIRVPV